MSSSEPLSNLRVVELGSQIAAPYVGKLFVDAGADVIKVESAAGDSMRRWSASGADLGGADSALFRYLNHGKRSVVLDAGAAELRELVAGADLLVEDRPRGTLDALGRPDDFPGLVWLSISPWGRTGPWSERPWTEFTIQAEAGSTGMRGLPGREPFQCGGRTPEWVAGTFAGAAALAAVHRARRTGHGEFVDFSMLESTSVAANVFTDLLFQMLGVEPGGPLPQNIETPSVEPTRDGYVGFCTNTRQQFSDFLLMIERPDLREDEELAQFAGRIARYDEWSAIVHAWTRRHATAEAVELASVLRIPVSPVNDGESVRRHEQLVARGVFRPDPRGDFECPRRPYRLDDEAPPLPRPAPALGEHQGRIEARTVERPVPERATPLPLAGVRILDITNWWAGPSATQALATLGAEVIHVESTRRPDGMRMIGGMLAGKYDAWWECSHLFLASNTNKLGVTLDLATEGGRELALDLVERCDAVFENFTPRVLDNFDLTWETIHARNPSCILVRMPAFGLTGPWRDYTGFAQTMEQMAGLAWVTGHRDDQPRIQRGPCDPLAGMHAVFAFLVALAKREQTGQGVHVESTMVEAALNVAAEQLVEFTAYGARLQRQGNRCSEAAPQGLYPCAGSTPGAEHWLALSIATDAQWDALRDVLGRPGWAEAPELATLAGRRAHHDEIDARLSPWIAAREREKLIDEFLAAGIPAAAVVDPRAVHRNPQMLARGFLERFEHPVVGSHLVGTTPYRYASVERWLQRAAPLVGQHNREVLGDLLGLDAAELERLEGEGVIGTKLEGR